MVGLLSVPPCMKIASLLAAPQVSLEEYREMCRALSCCSKALGVWQGHSSLPHTVLLLILAAVAQQPASPHCALDQLGNKGKLEGLEAGLGKTSAYPAPHASGFPLPNASQLSFIDTDLKARGVGNQACGGFLQPSAQLPFLAQSPSWAVAWQFQSQQLGATVSAHDSDCYSHLPSLNKAQEPSIGSTPGPQEKFSQEKM